MNLLSPVRLIPSRFLYINGAILGMVLLISVTVPKAGTADEDPAKALLFLMMVPLIIAGLLGTILQNALTRLPTAILPGIHRKLIGWTATTAAAVAIIWGSSTTLLFPVIPLPVAVSLSAALITLALPLSRQGWSNTRVITIVSAYMVARIVPQELEVSFAQAILSYPWITTGLAGTLTLMSLRKAHDRRRLKRLELTKLPNGRAATFRNWLQARGWRSMQPVKSIPNYTHRRSSLIGWVRAVHQERGGSGFTADVSVVSLFLVLAYPALTDSGGYPEAWHHLVFNSGSGRGPVILFMIWCMIVFLGLIAPAPRKEHLYPISRRRRATLAFVSLLVVWISLVLMLIGTPVLFAILTGQHLGLEMPREALVNFLAPAGITLPALALIRWSKLQFEGKIEFAPAFALITAFIGMVIGCSIASLAKPTTAVALACAAIAITLPLFYAGVRLFYGTDDLISRNLPEARASAL